MSDILLPVFVVNLDMSMRSGSQSRISRFCSAASEMDLLAVVAVTKPVSFRVVNRLCFMRRYLRPSSHMVCDYSTANFGLENEFRQY